MQLIIALALLGGAEAQINTLKYTQVGTGACRGNGGPADKVSGVYTQGTMWATLRPASARTPRRTTV